MSRTLCFEWLRAGDSEPDMDFVVLKVNGRDVSNASHEEAVAAFKSAREPILVEVLRRPASRQGLLSPCRADAFCQTEHAWRPEQGDNGLPPDPIPAPSIDDHDDDEGYDVEYEEVTLMRNGAGKLGLTLCYGDPDDPETEVYVGEIDPHSVAALDGRLQEGDQILQVNGLDVCSRDQAIALFSEARADFAILVARPHVQEEAEETAVEKDSGLGKTDESTRQEESSDCERLQEDHDAEMSVLAREFQRVTLDRKASVEQWVRNTAFLRKWDDSGSSAYHTGGSSSSPPTLELDGRSLLSLSRAAKGSARTFRGTTEDKGTQMRDADVVSRESCGCHPDPSSRRLPKTVSEPAHVQRGSDETDFAAALYPTMYTNPANLQRTMSLQQHLFREALARRGRHQKHSKETSPSRKDDGDLKSEWKVKRRADGTRYITRRAARSKLLKDREQKILEERCGLTTDDDRSELKTGKYWSKEERKRHLERAKDRKKKEMMFRLKMAIVKEANEEGKARKKPDPATGLLAVTTV